MGIIREKVEARLTKIRQSRLDKLIALQAPSVIIDKLQADLTEGDLASVVSKIKEFGHLEYISFEVQKYRRGSGVNFTLVDDTVIKFIPGPYGFFLVKK